MAELPEDRPREVEVTGELSPNCVVCNGDQFKQYLLPCLHSYGLCRKPGCKTAVEGAPKVTCTTCQSRFGDIRARVHHFATRLLKEEEVGGPYCWQCDKQERGIRAATYYCAHESCLSYLCEECQNSHATGAGTENHTVESLDRVKERNVRLNLRSEILFCENHARQKRDMYCRTCKDLVCSRCSQVEPHRSHTITDISRELCTGMREQVRLSEERIAGLLRKVERALECVEWRITQVQANTAEARRAINDDFNALQRQVQTRRQQLLQELDQLYDEKIPALTEQRDKLAAAVAKMRGFTVNVHKVVSKGSVEDHFTLKAAAKQRSAQLAQHVGTLRLDPVHDDHVRFLNRGQTRVQGSIRDAGQVEGSKESLLGMLDYIIHKYL